MSNFVSLTKFGSLVNNSTGRRVTFECLKEFDENNNGSIEENELKKAIKELNLDTVEFKNIDINGDKTLSQGEFNIWEQKFLMENDVNNCLRTVNNNQYFKPYFTQYKLELSNLMDSFIKSYTDSVSNMSNSFKPVLNKKFEELQQTLSTKDGNTNADINNDIKNEVLSDIYESILLELNVDGKNYDVERIKKYTTFIETLAQNFTSTYVGDTYRKDLSKYLNDYLNTPDRIKMKDATFAYKEFIKDYANKDEEKDDLKDIRNAVEEFLTTAIEQGVTVKLGSINVASEAAIKSALAQFTSAKDLMNAMQECISSLSDTSKKESLIETLKQDLEAEDYKKFADIKGSEYKINATNIDWNKIDPRYASGDEIHERGKGWSGSKDKAYDEGLKILNNAELKNQIKSQIKAMLSTKDIAENFFDDVMNNVFENVYNQSVQEALNAENMITGRGARGLSSKGHAYINVKNLCDTFITKFNTNIENAIDEMNASYTDFDTVDLDLSADVLNDGSVSKEKSAAAAASGDIENNDYAAAYATGKILTVRKHGAEYYKPIAENIIERLKPQFLKKAQNMCKANGVKFDSSKFTELFNKAKSNAVQIAVTGITSKGDAVGGVAASGGTAVLGTGAAIGAGVLTETVAVGSLTVPGFIAGTTVTTSYTATELLGSAALASTVPVAGWIAAGVGVVAAAAFAIFGRGRSSESSLNMKALVDNFTSSFKEDYTSWVNEEKAKKLNAAESTT